MLLDTLTDEAVLCKSCYEDLYDLFQVQNHDLTRECTVEEIRQTSSVTKQCDCCSLHIVRKHVMYIISVPRDVLNAIGDQLSEDIKGCLYCEGEERAHYESVFNDDPFDPTSRIEVARGTEISHYLYDQGVPDQFTGMFTALIQCRCGYGRERAHPDHNPTGGIFTGYDEVYTRQDMQEFYGFHDEEFCEFGERYSEQFTAQDLYEFRNHLMEYPMLGASHPTGQAIYQTLLKHFEAKEYSVLKPGHVDLFRGRTHKKDTDKAYEFHQMWTPPKGMPQHGRYNMIGVPVLYVADKLEAIAYEIHPAHDDVIDIAQLQITTDLTVFDIGQFDPSFSGFFSQPNEESKALKMAYLLPNYIGTCCSHIGYDGVKFSGVHDKEFVYTNYALFRVEANRQIKISHIDTYIPEINIRLDRENFPF
ncbi:hypothetical protein PAESOLCIP111_06729 [Paenibacillus solanacearum]|uniref:RES domain-containing protein n=1 Tax=Paenibacillus solanacearum TaxID=2048548 RepID=A0A916K9M2_9BACL|nr:RES family NAD+ phosphorylase [Paenibacillus solanacearum]CAG7653260.1 hypothetical protein PAESOLCIP111_06729 [Paenibacillus solanacearum]